MQQIDINCSLSVKYLIAEYSRVNNLLVNALAIDIYFHIWNSNDYYVDIVIQWIMTTTSCK